MSLRRVAGRVLIDISEDDYETLMLVLGFATGRAIGRPDLMRPKTILMLANAINEGNPNWTPYDDGAVPSPRSEKPS
jgi:hypothetical protein